MKWFHWLFVLVLYCAQLQLLRAQEDGDLLFDNERLHRIEIIAPGLTIEQMFERYKQEIGEGKYSYFKVDVRIDGTLIKEAGVRIKGQVTAFDNKHPLKLDFNRFVKKQKYDGI